MPQTSVPAASVTAAAFAPVAQSTVQGDLEVRATPAHPTAPSSQAIGVAASTPGAVAATVSTPAAASAAAEASRPDPVAAVTPAAPVPVRPSAEPVGAPTDVERAAVAPTPASAEIEPAGNTRGSTGIDPQMDGLFDSAESADAVAAAVRGADDIKPSI